MKKAKIITIKDIKYDTDGRRVKLPTTLKMRVDDAADQDDIEEAASEFISNVTGYCHKGFSISDKSKPKLTILKRMHPRRKCSFWYDGQVATLQKGSRTISIEATGHKELSFSPEGKQYSGEDAVLQAKRRKLFDKQINKIEMANCNWFTLVDLSDNSEPNDLENVIDSFDEALRQAKTFFN